MINTEISADLSTAERNSHPTTPNRPRPRGRLGRRLAGPGWVIMTLACVTITVIVSRYLTFDPEVYFPEQLEPYLQHEFALGVHVLSGMLALLIGPFQFVRRLRRRFVPVHRFMGATYVASATALGVTGLILAPTAYTGLVASAGFTVLDLAHALHDLDGRADDHGRPVRRAPSLDDPQLLADHGGSHVAGMDSDLRRAGRGRDRRLLLRDGVRRDRLAVLGAERAARDLVHPPPGRRLE